jgi:hypothetical protein
LHRCGFAQRYLEGFNTLHQQYKDKLVCRKVTIQPGPEEVEAFGMALQAADGVVFVAAVLRVRWLLLPMAASHAPPGLGGRA